MKTYDIVLSLPMSIQLTIEAPDKETAARHAMNLADKDPRGAVKNAAVVFSGTPSVEVVDELH